MSAFTGKTLMITGGTGSFGNTVLKHFLTTDIGEIRIFSRDEKKQDDMRHELQAKYPEYANKVQFYVGDVRNIQSVRDAMPGVDYIFHAAALKQVPSCEFFPMEAVRTNIEGTDNVLHAAIEAGVKRVVCLSTDKAAYPINAMGISKAMMEHVIFANARVAAKRGGTVICCTRYGNVMCSRGSVIPLFIDQIKNGKPITITDPSMTRFLMNLDEAVELVRFAFEHANPGDLFIQKADASTIGDLAKAVQQLFGDTGTNIIGTRHGEKLYETLMTKEERLRAEDMGAYYRVAADSRDLNYDKFVVHGEVHTMADESYTSHNTNRLDVEGTVKKILTSMKHDAIFYLLYMVSTIANAFMPDFYYRGIEKMKIITIRTFIIKGGATIGTFIFVREATDYWMIPLFVMLGNSIAVFAMFYDMSKKYQVKFRRVNFRFIFNLVKESSMFFISRAASTAYQAVNTIILSFIYGSSPIVGYYTSADKLISLGKTASGPIADSLYPYMIKQKNYKLVKKILLIFMPIIGIGVTVVFILAEPICIWLFGTEYAEAGNVLRCLLPILLVILPTYILCFPVMVPLGLSKWANMSNVVGMIIQILGLSILIVIGKLNIYTLCILSSTTEVMVFLFRLIVVIFYKRFAKAKGKI